MEPSSDVAAVLAEVGPRLKRLRTHRGVTLTDLAAKTGISKSTLSRLETGQRKPSLELLLPIAHAHKVPLDELVGATEIGDPRIRPKARKRNGRIVVPLSENTRGVNAWKVLIPPERGEPEFRIHEGYEWLYVLSGRMRLILGDHDITMGARRGGGVRHQAAALVRPGRRRARGGAQPAQPSGPSSPRARPTSKGWADTHGE